MRLKEGSYNMVCGECVLHCRNIMERGSGSSQWRHTAHTPCGSLTSLERQTTPGLPLLRTALQPEKQKILTADTNCQNQSHKQRCQSGQPMERVQLSNSGFPEQLRQIWRVPVSAALAQENLRKHARMKPPTCAPTDVGT